MISIPIDHSLNRSDLMRPCSPPRQPRGGASDLNRPLNFFRHEMTTQDQSHRLLLAVKRPASRGTNVVRRGHEQSIGELRTVRFGQKRVDLSFGDRSVGMIGLGLNGPQLTCSCASDNVDPCIRPPPLRPVLPQPDLVELPSIPRSVFQKPPAQPLEVTAKRRPLGITSDLRFDVLKGAWADRNRIRQSRSIADERSGLSGHRRSDRLQCSTTLARAKPLILGSQPIVPSPTAFLTFVSHCCLSQCRSDHRHAGITWQAASNFQCSRRRGDRRGLLETSRPRWFRRGCDWWRRSRGRRRGPNFKWDSSYLSF